MKRTLTIALFGLSAAALFGCPVFSGGSSNSQGMPCYDYNPYNGCGEPLEASVPDAGDCTVSGCPTGQVCEIIEGGVECVTPPDGGPGVSESGAGDAASDTATDAPVFSGCTSAAECTDGGDTGTLCLNGQCVAPANQCTDTTQCTNSEECVQGGCVPVCSSTAPCPTGYACTTNGVCSGNPAPCGAADGGTACASGTTCVEEHCVTPCMTGDAACGSGLVCVDGGCIPDQKPVFTCTTDGVQDACASGSICLHHSCYIACTPEASNSCATADVFNLCKPVTTSSGTYDVCASNTNLGSQCDPTRNLACASSTDICIDGFCR
jgi:hypothetical protein